MITSASTTTSTSTTTTTTTTTSPTTTPTTPTTVLPLLLLCRPTSRGLEGSSFLRLEHVRILILVATARGEACVCWLPFNASC